jgi:hypothetical protein
MIDGSDSRVAQVVRKTKETRPVTDGAQPVGDGPKQQKAPLAFLTMLRLRASTEPQETLPPWGLYSSPGRPFFEKLSAHGGDAPGVLPVNELNEVLPGLEQHVV